MTSLGTALDRIATHVPRPSQVEGTPAVVAIAVETAGDTPTFILTLRADSLRAHAAQYALPGGRVDPGETREEAVLREIEEEVGDRRWRIVGRLDDYATRSGYVVRPYVLLHEQGEADLRLNGHEVAEAYRVPIDATFDLQEVGAHELADGCMQCSTHGFDLFAPTGAILYQFLALWTEGRAPAVAHYREPAFAAR